MDDGDPPNPMNSSCFVLRVIDDPFDPHLAWLLMGASVMMDITSHACAIDMQRPCAPRDHPHLFSDLRVSFHGPRLFSGRHSSYDR